VQGAVTSKTKYLIAGANVGATKTEKARALGTEVIDEARLLELLGETSSDKAEQPANGKPSVAAPVQGDLFG
jgi:BRCT domain type II-containing protein